MFEQLANLPTSFSLRACWLFPGICGAVADATVTIHAGRIVSLSKADAIAPVIDLGDVVLLPGLINAHTHLEFSELPAPLGQPGMALPDWIQLVVAWRRERTGGPGAGIAAGIGESLAGGVTALGEIATEGWALPHAAPPGYVTAFRESIGLSPERAAMCLDASRGFLGASEVAGYLPGLSPHAPYTVRPELLADLVALATETHVPVAMHVAESREELELLRDGRGAMVDMLTELGAWRADAIPPGARPMDSLRVLAQAPRTLVIHGNYLDDEELDFLAEHGDRMSLVYCPRTHDYFRHAPYHDLAKLSKRGVRVCLGTDSRASNPDLDLLAELRFVAQRAPHLPGESILALATTNAASALGIESECGAIAVGRRADLCVLRTSLSAARDPFELIWDANATVEALLIAGKLFQGGPGPAKRAT